MAADNVVLVGFMGAGKSSMGRILARRLGRCFVETDDMITAREGLSIPEIFAPAGEAHFRAAEEEALGLLALEARRRHRHRRRPAVSRGPARRAARPRHGRVADGRLRHALSPRARRGRAADARRQEPRRGGGALPLARAVLSPGPPHRRHRRDRTRSGGRRSSSVRSRARGGTSASGPGRETAPFSSASPTARSSATAPWARSSTRAASRSTPASTCSASTTRRPSRASTPSTSRRAPTASRPTRSGPTASSSPSTAWRARVREINLRGAKLARDVRETMGKDVLVLGSIGPLGKYLAPARLHRARRGARGLSRASRGARRGRRRRPRRRDVLRPHGGAPGRRGHPVGHRSARRDPGGVHRRPRDLPRAHGGRGGARAARAADPRGGRELLGRLERAVRHRRADAVGVGRAARGRSSPTRACPAGSASG